jgi:hypothetical protein
MVEHRLPKPGVAGSIPVSRSIPAFSRLTLTVHTVQKQDSDDHTATIRATHAIPEMPLKAALQADLQRMSLYDRNLRKPVH